MKQLWEHIAKCKDQRCQVSHCVSSRYVLSHYHRCKDSRCAVCGPVREAIQRHNERAKVVAEEMKLAKASDAAMAALLAQEDAEVEAKGGGGDGAGAVGGKQKKRRNKKRQQKQKKDPSGRREQQQKQQQKREKQQEQREKPQEQEQQQKRKKQQQKKKKAKEEEGTADAEKDQEQGLDECLQLVIDDDTVHNTDVLEEAIERAKNVTQDQDAAELKRGTNEEAERDKWLQLAVHEMYMEAEAKAAAAANTDQQALHTAILLDAALDAAMVAFAVFGCLDTLRGAIDQVKEQAGAAKLSVRKLGLLKKRSAC
jgi:hypothetical protein